MILRAELMQTQKNQGVPLHTIEKDYVLGLILACLYRHPIIKDTWVFKGGTCLKKVYFPDFRFSEDLDFTLKPDASLDPKDIERYLVESFELGADLFGLIIDIENIVITPFLDKHGLFVQIRVPFQSPMMPSGDLPRIKLDLSKNEVLVDKPRSSLLFHAYSDAESLATMIQCYSLDEMFSEKCRALVERTLPRDLYDVIQLFERCYSSKDDVRNFIEIAELKFLNKGLAFPLDFVGIQESQFSVTRGAWEPMLSHQLSHLESIEDYLLKYRAVAEWISFSAANSAKSSAQETLSR